MQQISRIYLGNCGFETAWYDGVTLDLRDLDFHAPTDTVLNLENGGGKTSLLSLIFSCFETSQDRFLKHIQSRNNHFSQYFANDGTLGIILVEWLMPPRKAGEGSYRLITGQAVAVRAAADAAEIERMFFSFEEDEHLSLEEVPAPKLCASPLLSMVDFSRWIHDQQRVSPGNVYITRKQSDWHRHLEASQIDIEMLRMQVDFSAVEGGFDSGFLNFKSEGEFLRKFFGLTLDAKRAASVREAVATACDKLRRKPHFQRQLAQLQRFDAALATFAGAAITLQQERVHRLGLAWRGLRMAAAFSDKAEALALAAEGDSTFSKTQLAIAASALDSADGLAREHAVLTNLAYLRRTRQAATALDSLKQDHQKALLQVKLTRAAQLQRAIRAAQEEVEEMTALSKERTEELAPFLEKVEKDGALLRRALHDAAEALRAQAMAMASQAAQRETELKTLDTLIGRERLEKEACSTEAAKLETLLEAVAAGHARLLEDGAIESPTELASAASVRWAAHVETLTAEQTAFTEQKARAHDDGVEWEAAAGTARGKASQLDIEITAKNAYVGDGRAEQERLSQSPALTAAAESDLVTDLDSVALLTQLDKRIASFALQITGTDLRLAELEADRQAIEETGVAGFSPDVALVVRHLQAQGIRSAQPFNQYLAKAIADPAQARELVHSDPARFLGVCVASAELAACRAVQWNDNRPSKPVMVSAAALDPADAKSYAMVVPAATDAAYSVPAAQELKQHLDARHAQEKATRDRLEAARTASLSARTSLLAYRDKYGEGKLAAAQDRVQYLEREKKAALASAEHASAKAKESHEIVRGLELRIQELDSSIRTANTHRSALERFVRDHESQQTLREARLAELRQLEAQKTTAISDAELRQTALRDANLRAAGDTARLTADAQVLDKERAELRHYSTAVPAQEILKASPTSLEALRTAYTTAEEVYRTNAADRLGALQFQLNMKKDEVLSKRNAFTTAFPGVTGTDLSPFHHEDLDALLPVREAQAQHLGAAIEPAVHMHAEAVGAHKQWSSTLKLRLSPATPEQEALPDADLTSAIAAADANCQFARTKATEAKREGDAAATQAHEKSEEARRLRDQRTVLQSALSLDEQPDLPILELMLTSAGQDVAELNSLFVLETDTAAQVTAIIKSFNAGTAAYAKAGKIARHHFDALKVVAQEPEFGQVEPDLAHQMRNNEFEAAVDDIQRLASELKDRIAVVESNLADMDKDFQAAAEELYSLTQVAVSTLTSATRKTVPAGAPYVGGKAVLKMRSHLSSVTAEDRRRMLQYHLDQLIESGTIPRTGTDLAADAVLAINSKPLGLQVLKMVIEESQQYVAMDKITNSGGEGVVMAMFLYLVISQLRSDMQAKEQKAGGGPLILDNPFAKATTPALWKAQRMLANAMGVQLIFATAVQDYNTLGEFGKFVRLRRAGQNTKTRRWHLETADFQLHEPMAGAA